MIKTILYALAIASIVALTFSLITQPNLETLAIFAGVFLGSLPTTWKFSK